MKIMKITRADIYRDGGSYGFMFDSDDGNCYEFFLKINDQVKGPGPAEWEPPVLFFESCNSNKIVKKYSWSEAKALIAGLSFDSVRFRQLVDIINREGKIPEFN